MWRSPRLIIEHAGPTPGMQVRQPAFTFPCRAITIHLAPLRGLLPQARSRSGGYGARTDAGGPARSATAPAILKAAARLAAAVLTASGGVTRKAGTRLAVRRVPGCA